MVDFISDGVIVSTQSADEVGRMILSKFKKQKKKNTQTYYQIKYTYKVFLL